MGIDAVADDWVPEACTLPTAEQPLRLAEFDDLFARDVLTVRRESGHRIVLELRPGVEAAARAAGLAVKESGCCSFFAFDLVVADGAVSLGIETASAHEAVLAALGARAESWLEAGA